MINQKQLKELLLEKKADLDKELAAINILLGSNDGKVYEHDKPIDNDIKKSEISGKLKDGSDFPKVSSKGESEIWKNYILRVMKTLGGKVKSKDIAEIIVNANKDMTENKVISQIRDKLAQLANENLIIVYKEGFSRKTGYEYEILDK